MKIDYEQISVLRCYAATISKQQKVSTSKIHGHLRKKFNYSSHKKLTKQQFKEIEQYIKINYDKIDFSHCY